MQHEGLDIIVPGDSEGKKIAAASGDGSVMVWSSETGKLMYKLPGHKGTVNCAEFSPGKDPIREFKSSPSSEKKLLTCETSIVLSASSDRNMLLGELR